MVSLETARSIVYAIFIAIVVIVVVFIVKLPVVCTGCEDQVGSWYRCLSGGLGTVTCTSTGGLSDQIARELTELGIQLPAAIISQVTAIKQKIVDLATSITNSIKSVVGNAFSMLSKVFNDYIRQPIVTGYKWIKDSVILPIIEGITNYIVRPIQSLIESIIGIRDAAFDAIKKAFAVVKQVGVTVFDYTYGALIAGFDEIPLGLVDFIEGIQDVLNFLKHNIIGGVKPGKKPDTGANVALYGLLKGIQGGVNGMIYVANSAINLPIKAINALPGIKVAEDPIPTTRFADDFSSWIDEPKDLFWAGAKTVPESSIVSSPNGICQIACSAQGYDTGKANTAEKHTNECLCKSEKTLTNTNAMLSCTDVCSAVGGVSMVPQVGMECPVCNNELVFNYYPFTLPYKFIITFNNSPIQTITSSVTFDISGAATQFTQSELGNTLATKLATDSIALLDAKGVDILNQGVLKLDASGNPLDYTKYDASWFNFQFSNGLYNFTCTQKALTQLSTIAQSLEVTTVNVDIVLLFSKNSVLAQTFGFVNDATVSTNFSTNPNSTSAYSVPKTSSAGQTYINQQKITIPNFDPTPDSSGNIVIPYPPQPTISTVTPVNAFVNNNGRNFFYLAGVYYGYLDNIFYKIRDQSLFATNLSLPELFEQVILQSSSNCPTTFNLFAVPNKNFLKYSYADASYQFTDTLYFDVSGANIQPAITTQATFFTQLSTLLVQSLNQSIAGVRLTKSLPKIANIYSASNPPLTFTVSNLNLTIAMNTAIKASITFFLAKNQLMSYNFNSLKDITVSRNTLPIPTSFKIPVGSDEKSTVDVPALSIPYKFTDKINEYDITGTARVTAGKYAYGAIPQLIANQIAADVNVNTDNFFNFNTKTSKNNLTFTTAITPVTIPGVSNCIPYIPPPTDSRYYVLETPLNTSQISNLAVENSTGASWVTMPQALRSLQGHYATTKWPKDTVPMYGTSYTLYGEWFQIQFAKGFKLSSYSIIPVTPYSTMTSTNDVADIYEFVILGSVDGTSWYFVDTQTSEEIGLYVTDPTTNQMPFTTQSVYNQYAYVYYRIVVTQMFGKATQTSYSLKNVLLFDASNVNQVLSQSSTTNPVNYVTAYSASSGANYVLNSSMYVNSYGTPATSYMGGYKSTGTQATTVTIGKPVDYNQPAPTAQTNTITYTPITGTITRYSVINYGTTVVNTLTVNARYFRFDLNGGNASTKNNNIISYGLTIRNRLYTLCGYSASWLVTGINTNSYYSGQEVYLDMQVDKPRILTNVSIPGNYSYVKIYLLNNFTQGQASTAVRGGFKFGIAATEISDVTFYNTDYNQSIFKVPNPTVVYQLTNGRFPTTSNGSSLYSYYTTNDDSVPVINHVYDFGNSVNSSYWADPRAIYNSAFRFVSSINVGDINKGETYPAASDIAGFPTFTPEGTSSITFDISERGINTTPNMNNSLFNKLFNNWMGIYNYTYGSSSAVPALTTNTVDATIKGIYSLSDTGGDYYTPLFPGRSGESISSAGIFTYYNPAPADSSASVKKYTINLMKGIALSNDGSKIYGVTNNIFLSTTPGKNASTVIKYYSNEWNYSNTKNLDSYANAIACSSDGTIVVLACVGAIYLSYDSGVSYIQASIVTNSSSSVNTYGANNSLTISGNGTYIAMASNMFNTTTGSDQDKSSIPGLLLSRDNGTTWLNHIYFTNKNIISISLSSEGRYWLCLDSGNLYSSINYGFSFTKPSLSISGTFKGSSMSSDGKYQMALTSTGTIYYCNNATVLNKTPTWTTLNPSGVTSSTIYSVFITASGQYQFVIGSTSFYSWDYGNSWAYSSNLNVSGISTSTQTSVFFNSSGTYMAVLQPTPSSTQMITIPIPGTTTTVTGTTCNSLTVYASAGSLGVNWAGRDSYFTSSIVAYASSLSYSGTSAQVIIGKDIVGTGPIPLSGTSVALTKATVPNYPWASCSISYEGKYITLLSTNSAIYNSSDYGATFVPIESTAISQGWLFSKMSLTGQYQLACSSTESISNSTDFGKTWGPVSIPYSSSDTNVAWVNVAMSATGQYQSLISNGSGLFFTNNYGKAWSNTNWIKSKLSVIAMSATGQYQTTADGTTVYYSSDYGNTFTKSISGFAGCNVNFAPNQLVISASGQYQLLCDNKSGIYNSADYGQTWTMTWSGNATFTDANMSNFYSFNNGVPVIIIQDGLYQFVGITTGYFLSRNNGVSWSYIGTSLIYGSFVYDSLTNPTYVKLLLCGNDGNMYHANMGGVSTPAGYITKANCYQTQLTTTLSFVCHNEITPVAAKATSSKSASSSNVAYIPPNVQSAVLTVNWNQMTPNNTIASVAPLSTLLGLGSNPATTVLFDTNYEKNAYTTDGTTTNTYVAPIEPIIVLFDQVLPPFCGQNNEYKIGASPSSFIYYFTCPGFAVTNTLDFSRDPVDAYGIVQLGEPYTIDLLVTTLNYLLTQDIMNLTKNNVSPVFAFRKVDRAYVFAFDPSFTIPATLTIRTGLNFVLSGCFQTSGYDLVISSVNELIITPPTVPKIYMKNAMSNLTDQTLQYTVKDVTGYLYEGSITTPANGNTPEYLVETILPKLLVNDINKNTNNKYALPQTAFKFESLGTADVDNNNQYYMTRYIFTLEVNIPTVLITLLFVGYAGYSGNFVLAKALGITKDVSMFNLNYNKFETTGPVQDNNIIFHQYKGWDYYLIRDNNYLYVNPYLLKMNEIPTPATEIPINRNDLANYYSVNTSDNIDDAYYYTNVNGIDNFYVLIDQHSAFPIDFSVQVNVPSGDPVSSGYVMNQTEDKSLNYYTNPTPDWYVPTNDGNLLQVAVTPVVSIDNPNKLSYTFKQGGTKFTSSVLLPIETYDDLSVLATTLTNLLTTDISAKTPISATSIQIVFQPVDENQSTLLKQFSFSTNNTGLNTVPYVTPPEGTSVPVVTPTPTGLPDFQLTLLTSQNSVMQTALGVTGDIVMNPYLDPITTGSATLVSVYSLAYVFTDSNFTINKFVTLTKGDLASYAGQLPGLLVNSIIAQTGYTLKPTDMKVVYDTSGFHFTFAPSVNLNAKLTLSMTKTAGTSLYPSVTVPLTQWAPTFGFTADIVLSPGTTVSSTKTPVLVPMSNVKYSLKDVSSTLSIEGTLEFSDTLFTNNTTGEQVDLVTPLTNLLIDDINSKQSMYVLRQDAINIEYDPGNQTYTMSFIGVPLLCTLYFSKNSLLGINYGCNTDVTFKNSAWTASSVTAINPFLTYKGLAMYFYKAQLCTFVAASPSGLYPLVTGKTFCLGKPSNEVTPQDPTLPLSYYGYQNKGSYYLKYNSYVYDVNGQTLFLLMSLVEDYFYGSVANNGFTPLTSCAVDSNGKCIAPAIPIYKLVNSVFLIVQKETLSLLPFARDELTDPNCPCRIEATIIPTCNEICRSKTSKQLNLEGGSNDPLLCSNPNDDPLTTPCQCYYNGPVNVIVKPMQEFNPFRLIQGYASSGGSSFTAGIANGIKGFMLPLWNTIKLVAGLLSSIIYMIVETITTYANPVYVFGLIGNLLSMGAEEAMGALKKLWSDVISPALSALWGFKDVIFNGITKVAGIIWENVKIVLQKVSAALAAFITTAVSYGKVAITYAWNGAMVVLGGISKTFLPFVPGSDLLKTNILFVLILVILATVWGIDKYIEILYDIIIWLIQFILNFFTTLLFLLKQAILPTDE